MIVRHPAPQRPGEPGGLSADHALLEGAGPGSDPPVVYAGLVTRAIAITIDALVIDVAALVVAGAVLVVISVFSVRGIHHKALVAVIGSVLFAVWIVSYFAVFWTTTGQTPGGRVMQTRVTCADGARVRPRRALARLAGMVVSLPFFWGYLPMLWSARRRCVFDVVAGTVVTHARAGPRPDAARRRPAHESGIEPPTAVPSPGAD